MYRAPPPLERERWHARWLLAQGRSADHVAAALERDPRTIGNWLAASAQDGPAALIFEHTGSAPCAGYMANPHPFLGILSVTAQAGGHGWDK